MENEEVLVAVNEALARIAQKGTNEQRLIEVLETFPCKYDFGDNDVRLELKIDLDELGQIEISRCHSHSGSDPLDYRFRSGSGECRNLVFKSGEWVFDDD